MLLFFNERNFNGNLCYSIAKSAILPSKLVWYFWRNNHLVFLSSPGKAGRNKQLLLQNKLNQTHTYHLIMLMFLPNNCHNKYQQVTDYMIDFLCNYLRNLYVACYNGKFNSLYSKLLCSAVEKGNLGMLQLPGQGCSFHSFCTNTYKLSFMESPSGIKVSYNSICVSIICYCYRTVWMKSLLIIKFSVEMFCTLAFAHFFIDNCSYFTFIL